MTVIFWVLIVVCFALAFVGLMYPVIPGVLVLWGGFLIYQFGINHLELTWTFWGLQILFTVILFVADFIANSYFLKKYGSTKWGERIGVISILVGSFVFPPFGLLIVPFFSVLMTELLHKKSGKEAFAVALATVISFLSSSVAKAVIQLLMIAVFILYVVL
ncbi:DUF456 domain-containing protein [Ectobacillus sp. JY-23]|uniref:DUF456 domain-containing protein n=1 Tax=Ectobacillus sp. JY-23 TaxID=2933872 RepID=UPI001FF61A23|nr:DUF456 domain-containing protein [Ectobacillus sp. JY-23]UOY92775.1 DUF456 domain-containing protein [Ectobacillus sp. JY-23]